MKTTAALALPAALLIALAACAEPIPERSDSDADIMPPPAMVPEARDLDNADLGAEGSAGIRAEPLLSAITLADRALLGTSNVANCSFEAENGRKLFQTAVIDEQNAEARGVARVNGEPVIFTARFAGAQATMERGGPFGSDGELTAELIRSDVDGRETGIKTRAWPAQLEIGYTDSQVSARSAGTWSCGN